MKLFRPTGNVRVIEMKYPELEFPPMRENRDPNEVYISIPKETGKIKIEQIEQIELELVPETVDYIMNNKGGGTLERIRQLILHLFNHRYYTDLDLFGLMRNADDEHIELAMNIIESCSLKYGDSCFKMIDDLAPKMIDRFGYADREEKE